MKLNIEILKEVIEIEEREALNVDTSDHRWCEVGGCYFFLRKDLIIPGREVDL